MIDKHIRTMFEVKVLVRTDGALERSFVLRPGKWIVGRSPDSDIPLDDTTVSLKQCELQVSDGSVTIRDLDSTNGSFVNGKRIRESEIQADDSVQLGRVELEFDISEVRVAIPEIVPAAEPASVVLANGAMSCLNHRDIPARFRCARCERLFCENCVRSLRRITGGILRFCPVCPNAQCTPASDARERRVGRAANVLRSIQKLIQPRRK